MKHTAAVIAIVAAVVVAGCQPRAQVQTGPQTIEIGEYDPPAPPLPDSVLPPPAEPEVADVPPPTAPAAPGAPATPVMAPPPPPTAGMAPPPPPPIAEARVHVVQPNETLWRISGMYYGRSSRVNVDKIVAANPGLDPDVIRIGQKIIIPE